jgi:F420H(2)-dependent quinone reductase
LTLSPLSASVPRLPRSLRVASVRSRLLAPLGQRRQEAVDMPLPWAPTSAGTQMGQGRHPRAPLTSTSRAGRTNQWPWAMPGPVAECGLDVVRMWSCRRPPRRSSGSARRVLRGGPYRLADGRWGTSPTGRLSRTSPRSSRPLLARVKERHRPGELGPGSTPHGPSACVHGAARRPGPAGGTLLGVSDDATYEPSPVELVRNQVELYESSGGTEGTTIHGLPVVVLTMRGARTGKIRKTPVMRVEHQGRYVAVASLLGAPKHPIWYYNLLANPRIELQDGPAKQPMLAREVDGVERDQWWARAVAAFPGYAEYQRKTDRVLPVFVLEPVSD